MIAIQDCYPPEFAHCYGCGASNPQGLHLKSYLQGEETVAEFTPDDKYSGGYPGNVYGGHCQVVFNRRLRAPFPASGGECFGHVCPEAECVSPGVAV